MTGKLWRIWMGGAVLTVLALVAATVAVAAGTAKTATSSAGTTSTTSRAAQTGETPLTGGVLAQVEAAAVAKTGGTVDSATTEHDGGNASAAYEAHVTRADGSHVTVILDQQYNVLSVQSGHGRGGHGWGGSGETALTGDVARQAKAAAVAKVGGTADSATTENDSSNTAAAYEVHVTKADGTHVKVILDKQYNVLSVEAHAGRGR